MAIESAPRNVVSIPRLNAAKPELQPWRAVRSCRIEPRIASLRNGRRHVWGPIVLRAVALGIALAGLAGIGAALSPAPPSSPSAIARAGFGLDGFSTRALAALAGTGGGPADVSARAIAPPANRRVASGASPGAAGAGPGATGSANPGAAGSASRDSLPCARRAEEKGESSSESAPSPNPRASPPNALLVSLNRAGAAELQRLPGVGAKRAQAILALRQRLGRFQRPADLLRVKGIGHRTLERMRPHVTLD